MQPLTRGATAAFAAVTVLGVLSGAALGGAGLDEPGPLALAVALAALLALGRRWPLTALGLAASTILALRIAGLTGPGAGWLWPATLLYVPAVLRRGIAPVVTIAAVHAVAAFNIAWTVLQQPAARALGTVGIEALWLTAAIAVAVSYRNWRRWQAESLQRLRTELEEQRTAERLGLAREVHDAVAHTLAVVGVHVNVAADALDDDPQEARAALRLAQEVRRRAMADLRSLVGVLRSPPPSLEDFVAVARDAGLDASLRVTGDEEAVPLPVRLVAAAVVREALTNVVRHARAACVAVEVHYGPSTEVTVTDDGAGTDASIDTAAETDLDAAPGHGLRGLAERVTALGGTLSARPGGDGRGFVVRATMPQ